MNTLNGHLVKKVRIFTFVCFCLWICLLVIDYFTPTVKVNRYSLFSRYLPYYNGSNQANGTTKAHYQLSQFVQLRPDQLDNHQIVLYWTNYFGSDVLEEQKKIFGDPNAILLYRPEMCYQQYPNCLLTTDRVYLQSAQAVIFHWRDLQQTLPDWRSLEQLWTVVNMESPMHTPHLPEGPDWVFNLTAGYRFDSDIHVPYGRVIPRKVPLSDLDPSLKVDVRYKTKPIAWFVSNCQTPSHREDYVKELSKYVQVDVYGACGEFQCPKSDNGDDCYRKAARKYLFYLSFENSICIDYVTEKLFNILNYDMIPIVYGGANYTSLLPSKSFIDATEMRPKDLAHLLMAISNDGKEYLSYFAWRKHYYVDTQLQGYNIDLFCNLCKRLHQFGNSTNQTRMILRSTKQINSWYFAENACNYRRTHLF